MLRATVDAMSQRPVTVITQWAVDRRGKAEYNIC